MSSLKAIGWFILIEEIKESVKTTDGGLLLTDAHTQDIRYVQGKVITPGTEVKGVEAGDIVLYDRHAGHGIEVDGEFYLIIQERDIALVL